MSTTVAERSKSSFRSNRFTIVLLFRFVIVPTAANGSSPSTIGGAGPDKGPGGERMAKFLPLDSPFSRHADTSHHPPLFACILRRTTGIKVLECHGFVCKREQAANALVRCCFHAYADSMHAKQLDESPYSQLNGHSGQQPSSSQINGHGGGSAGQNGRRSRSISALDSVEKVEAWRHRSTEALADPNLDSDHTTNGNGHITNGNGGVSHRSRTPSEAGASSSKASHSPGDDSNYKVWNNGGPPMVPLDPRHPHHPHHQMMYPDGAATLRSVRSAAVGSVMSMSRIKGRQPPPMMLGPPRSLSGMPMPHHPHQMPFLAPVPTSTLKKDKGLKNSLRKLKKKHGKNGAILAPIHPAMMAGHHPPPHVLPNGYVMMPVPPPHGMPPQFHHGPPPPHPMYGGPPPGSMYGEPRRLRRNIEGPPPMNGHGHYNGAGGPGGDQEIAYMPQMRPVTPLSGFHPDQPHYVQYQGQEHHFGTTGRPDKDSKKGRKKSGSKKGDSGDLTDESPFNTGIYKKKGHLNERAFSYSIRQEHRSRSNSLANIELNEQQQNGHIHEVEVTNHHHERLSNGHAHGSNGDLVNGKLARSFESLHLQTNGHAMNGISGPPNENGHANGVLPKMPKTASIKRGSQNGLSKMVGIPVAPPPVPLPNGKGAPPMMMSMTEPMMIPPPMTNGKLKQKAPSPKSQKSK